MKKHSYIIYLFVTIITILAVMMFVSYCNNLGSVWYIPGIGTTSTVITGDTTITGSTTSSSGTTITGSTTSSSSGSSTTGSTTSSSGTTTTSIGNGYYDAFIAAHGNETGDTFKQSLENLLDNPFSQQTYSGLWNAYKSTDDGVASCATSQIFCMYTTLCYTYDKQDNGTGGTVEGDKYNREHTWPKSWFGGTTSGPGADLMMVLPMDKKFNSMRGDNPYGNVTTATYTSPNSGAKIGIGGYGSYTGTVCEPINQYKGDLARIYFYFAVKYYQDLGVYANPAVEGSYIKQWQEMLLYSWHTADPVSQKERDRNDRVQAIQKNRNPFVDYPEWVDKIYSTDTATASGF